MPADPADRLIRDRWRAPALVAAVVGALIVPALGTVVRHGRSTVVDDRILSVLAHLSGGWRSAALATSTPAIPVILLVVVALTALRRHRRDLALLCLLGPGLAVGLTQFVAKPVVGRSLAIGDVVGKTNRAVPSAFPSGHETLVTATALVLVVALGQVPLRRATRATTGAVLAAWAVVAAIGLVVDFWHYATDTVGALGVSLATVLGVALTIDGVRAREHGPAQLTARS